MPNYSYRCKKCDNYTEILMSVVEFSKLNSEKKSGLSCSKCNLPTLERVFGVPGSKVERRKEEIIASAKDEARTIIKRIKNGNQNAIRDIYGGES